MVTFEYKIVPFIEIQSRIYHAQIKNKEANNGVSDIHKAEIEVLNLLGKDGWELCGIVQNQEKSVFFFKRAKLDKEDVMP